MASEENKKEVQELKDKLKVLTKKLENQPKTNAAQDIDIKKELQDLKNKYIFLLENMIRLQSQEQRKLPAQFSKPPQQLTEQISSLGNLQVLLLLKQSKATSKEFAVTSIQLKIAYNINKSERTVRNKLNYLEQHNLVVSFGKKPKLYFVTPSGLVLLEKQRKDLLFSNGFIK